MKAILSRRSWFALTLTAALCATPVQAAAPRDELLRLVPEDVGFCVVVQDLRSHIAALTESPLVAQFRNSLLGMAIRTSPEFEKLEAADKLFKEQFGIDSAQLRDDIFGDCVVLAYRPGPPGKPEQDQGLFLVRARNGALLTGLIDRLNAGQKKAGDLQKLEEREYNGVKYFHRVERKQPPYFYWQRGPLLAAATQEEMLRRVIDLDRRAPSADTETPPLLSQIRQLGADKSLLAVWLNPRAFEADLDERVKAAIGPEAAFLKTFQSNWKALEGIALTLNVQQQLELGVAVRAKPEALSPGLRKFLTEAAKPSDLWRAFPDNALFAAAGRVDLAALLDMVGEFLPEEGRKALRDAIEQGSLLPPAGKLVKEILPSLGPDVGFCIMAPKPDDKDWFPRGVWALRVRPGKDKQAVDQALLDGLNVVATLAILDHNHKNPADRMTLKSVTQDKVEVKYLVNDKRFPPGVQPAYTVKDGYLLFASSPEAVRGFQMAGESPSGEDVPLLRLSPAALREYVEDRRDPLAEHLAERHQITKEEAIRRLESLRMGLQFLDRVELVQRSTAGQVQWTLRIKTSQPLRK